VIRDEDQQIADGGSANGNANGPIVYTFLGEKLRRRQRDCVSTMQGQRIAYPIKRLDEKKDVYDLTRVYMDEFLRHPFGRYDDLIDAVPRIYDINPRIPELFEAEEATESILEDAYVGYEG
jgi:hypothetical protein